MKTVPFRAREVVVWWIEIWLVVLSTYSPGFDSRYVLMLSSLSGLPPYTLFHSYHWLEWSFASHVKFARLSTSNFKQIVEVVPTAYQILWAQSGWIGLMVWWEFNDFLGPFRWHLFIPTIDFSLNSSGFQKFNLTKWYRSVFSSLQNVC